MSWPEAFFASVLTVSCIWGFIQFLKLMTK